MSEKQNGKVRLTGQLKLYMELPAVMAFLLAALNIWIYRLDRRAGFLMLFFVLIYIFMVGYLYIYSKSIVMKDLVEFAAGVVEDFGSKSVADKLVFAGKVIIFTVSVPIIQTLVALVGSFLELV